MKKISFLIMVLLLATLVQAQEKQRVGVVYMVHGGVKGFTIQSQWESVIKIFFYNPNSLIYKRIIWNQEVWPQVLQFGNAPKELGKYSFEYERIGGLDPFDASRSKQLADMTSALKAQQQSLGVEFVVDWMGWIAEDPAHLPQPRLIYQPQVKGGDPMTYCGSENDDGPWKDCDPQRFNIDGTIDRMLAADLDQLLLIDMTTSGVRFSKTYDMVALTQQIVDQHNRDNNKQLEMVWLNDPTGLMRESYPTLPEGWTKSLGHPEHDPKVPLQGRPNPVSSDPEFAAMMVDGIVSRFNPAVAPEDTAVMLLNHTISDFNEYYDPKIDDTLVLNDNIKAELLKRYPKMKADNIIGSWMGQKTVNNNIKGKKKKERTREMRGEALGRPYLYETERVYPDGEWQYRYWDALALLKDQGAKHIVTIFPQIISDSVLNMVELPNQIAKEIGYKNWLYIDELDYKRYPKVGHPFAEYWGVWVDTMCHAIGNPDQEEPCCFTMGGCGTAQPYPPERQTPLKKRRDDLDPSLAYDVSEFGHVGYDSAKGAPNISKPVQNQYTGTWSMWQPPNQDVRVGKFLAKHVMLYLQPNSAQVPE
ncbi:hypothetical protein BST96_02805 [Oceanicoccus sagamiensis]|uniref:Uncharacterized protein n=2 Tax=Oceanicoccus sagamiensis TaxID=716816 RepID=A0A1X9N4R5_9GAMM|nr:hypothetical protein BST96_02805 [Oceanicoccus sagamiensis]